MAVGEEMSKLSLYHLVPATEMTPLIFNKVFAHQVSDVLHLQDKMLWEKLGPDDLMYLTVVADSSMRFEQAMFKQILDLLSFLDDKACVYKSLNKPNEILKNHIVTTVDGKLTLINKHLFKRAKGDFKYVKPAYLKNLLISLSKPTDEDSPQPPPSWVTKLLNSMKAQEKNSRPTLF